jgi:hypothetical protein
METLAVIRRWTGERGKRLPHAPLYTDEQIYDKIQRYLDQSPFDTHYQPRAETQVHKEMRGILYDSIKGRNRLAVMLFHDPMLRKWIFDKDHSASFLMISAMDGNEFMIKELLTYPEIDLENGYHLLESNIRTSMEQRDDALETVQENDRLKIKKSTKKYKEDVEYLTRTEVEVTRAIQMMNVVRTDLAIARRLGLRELEKLPVVLQRLIGMFLGPLM